MNAYVRNKKTGVDDNTTYRSMQSLRTRLRLKCDGTRAETRFRLSVKRTSPFKSAGAWVQSTGSRGVRINGNNAGYTMFRGCVKSTGYPLHSPVSPSLPLRASQCSITFRLDSTNTMDEGFSDEANNLIRNFDVFLTVHHSIDFSKYQLSAQFF